MVRRLVVGLILGLIVGGLVAAGLVAGLHQTLFDGGAESVFAYLAAAVTGVLTGLVAGKPIWASGARIEAGLKAFFGALLGAGIMFAVRRWVSFPVDLAFAGLPGGAQPAGLLPEVSLPLVAAVLGGFFELDNNGSAESKDEAKDKPKKRVADEKAAKGNGKSKARVPDEDDGEEEQAAPVASKRAKR